MAREESTLQLFTVLAAFVEERLGLRYSWDDRSLLLDKVESRALEVGHDSLLQYYYLLRYDDPEGSELAKLAAVLSVGETYLFREPDALFLLADDVIPRVLRERGRARAPGLRFQVENGRQDRAPTHRLERRGRDAVQTSVGSMKEH